MPEDCYGGNFFETADEACSSDSSLLRRAVHRCGGGWDEKVTSQLSRKGGGGIMRGQSKEFLRVEVRAAGTFAAGKSAGAQDPVDSSLHFISRETILRSISFRHPVPLQLLGMRIWSSGHVSCSRNGWAIISSRYTGT